MRGGESLAFLAALGPFKADGYRAPRLPGFARGRVVAPYPECVERPRGGSAQRALRSGELLWVRVVWDAAFPSTKLGATLDDYMSNKTTDDPLGEAEAARRSAAPPEAQPALLSKRHKALGARLVDYAGHRMPLRYGSAVEEHRAVRASAGVFDVSHMGRFCFEGPRALAAVDSLMANAVGRLTPGRAKYSCCCNAQGGILDDVIVYCLRADRVLVVCNAANRAKLWAHFEPRRGDSRLVDLSAQSVLLAVQGPRALGVLGRCIGADMSAMRPFAVLEHCAGGRSFTVARTGYTGEDGAEVMADENAGGWLFEELVASGVTPSGLAARDTLRLEASLPLYGQELDESTHPKEAGLGWSVKLVGRDFVGSAALRTLQSAALHRTLVGLMLEGRGIARTGYSVLSEAGQALGQCTSGAPSPTLGRSIALAYVPPAFAAEGTRCVVDCRGRAVPAAVVPRPFYRRPA